MENSNCHVSKPVEATHVGKVTMLYKLQVMRQAMFIKYNIKARSCNHRCNGKAVIITYPECVFVALCINIFTTLSNKWYDFQKKKLLNIKCVF